MKNSKFVLVMLAFAALSAAAAAFMQGCSGGPCNCDKLMERTRAEFGNPDEIHTSVDGGTYSQDWWYNYRGLKYNFRWGEAVSDCCEVNVSTFPPIQ